MKTEDRKKAECAVLELGSLMVNWYKLPHSGLEGTLDGLLSKYEKGGDTWHEDDITYLKNLQATENKKS